MKRIVATTVALCALVLYGCPSDKVALSVKLYKPCNQEDTFKDVNYLSVTVNGQDFTAPIYQEYNFSDGAATVPDIPLSAGVRMEVQAFSDGSIATETLAARGVSAPFDLDDSAETMDVSILVSRVNAFASTTDLSQPADGAGALACSFMPAVRQGHATTLLPDGKVLITGGVEVKGGAPFYSGALTVYDPGTGTFADLEAVLNFPRAYHTASLVNTGSPDAPVYKVLVAGGLGIISNLEQSLTTAEVFDVTGQVIEEPIFQNVGRAFHTATVMGNGDVVLIGGISKEPSGGSGSATTNRYLDDAEVFDAAGGAFTPVASKMSAPRTQHTATYLAITQDAETGAAINEKIFIFGGRDDKHVWRTVQMYTHDEKGRGFTRITNDKDEDVMMTTKRYGHVGGRVIVSSSEDPRDPAVIRNDVIKIVVAGGYQCIKGCVGSDDCCGSAAGFPTEEGSITNSVEVFDPFQGYIGAFISSTALKLARADATISELPDRKLLVAGGKGTDAKPRPEAEVLVFDEKGVLAKPDYTSNKMAEGRYQHAATALDSGMILISGGFGANGTLDSAEIYSPVFPVVVP